MLFTILLAARRCLKNTMTLDTLKESVQDCQACNLHLCRERVTFGEGCVSSPKVMFISDAPSEGDEASNHLLTDEVGLKFNEMLAFLDLDRDQVYVTNAVLCRPPNDRQPHMEEISACRGRLIGEIRLVNPGLIVVLGRTAMKALLGYEFSGPLQQFMEDGTFLKIESGEQEYLAAVVASPNYHIRNPRMARKLTGKMWQAIRKQVSEKKVII